MRRLRLDAQARPIVDVVNQLIDGRSNANGVVTLTPSTTTTTVTLATIAEGAAVVLGPMTANAAAAVATTYVSSVANGSFVLTHANNAQVDRTFRYLVIGG